MILSHLRLRDFRNYEALDLAFGEGINILAGPNASGKTNLAEAVFFLSFAKSWRTPDSAALIRSGCESSLVSASMREGEMKRKIEIEIFPNGKRISINDRPISRLSELAGAVNAIVFSPKDTTIFKGPPSERRAFIDGNLSKKEPGYLPFLRRFQKLLQERNALLKTEKPDERYLDVVTGQLVDASAPIERFRAAYVNELNQSIAGIANSLYGESKRVEVKWEPFIEGDDFQSAALTAYRRSLNNDILRKTTSLGIHHEDFSLFVDGRDVGLYGSQGENRVAAIALKLTPFFLISDEEKKPIVILDDVFSELDQKHAGRLKSLMRNLNQVFVTTVDTSANSNACLIEVSHGTAIRRN